MPRKIAANTIAGMSSGSVSSRVRWNQLAPSTEPGLEDLLRQRLQAGVDDDEDERRPLPASRRGRASTARRASRTASRRSRDPSLTASQLSSPHCGLSSARHISPTTIGVSSIGRIRIPRTIAEPRRFWLKKSASAVPSDDLDRDAGRHQDQRVLDDRPELAAREQVLVVAEPDPAPGVLASGCSPGTSGRGL